MDRTEERASFCKRRMANFKIRETTKGALKTMGLSPKEITAVETVCESRESPKQAVLKEEVWGILAKLVASIEDTNRTDEEVDRPALGDSSKEPPSPAASFKSAKDAEAPKKTDREPPICWHYKNGICRFGGRGRNKDGSCPFAHPKKCEKFAFGGLTPVGCRFKGCKRLHPFLCKTWKRGQNCSDADCKRLHPTVASDRSGQPALQGVQQQPENSRPAPWGAQSQSSQQLLTATQQQSLSASQQQQPNIEHTQGVSQAFLERRLQDMQMQMQAALMQQIATSVRAAFQQQLPPSPRVPQPPGGVGPPPGFNRMWPSVSQASQHQ